MPVEVECDIKAVCEKIVQKSPVLICGNFLETGKCHAGKYAQQMGNNLLFAVPADQVTSFYKKRMRQHQLISSLSGFPVSVFQCGGIY